MIRQEEAKRIAADFLCWLLKNRNSEDKYFGLWGGDEATKDLKIKHEWTGDEELWDIWTTTMNVIGILVEFGFDSSDPLIKRALKWLEDNYTQIPKRRKIAILKTLFHLVPANFEKFKNMIITDIKEYLENCKHFISEKIDDQQYLQKTDSDTPYHILSCYLHEKNRIDGNNNIFDLEINELEILINLYIKTAIANMKQRKYRLSYALLCLNYISSNKIVKDLFEKLIMNYSYKPNDFAAECLSYSLSLKGPEETYCKYFAWREDRSIGNCYEILSLTQYRSCEYFSGSQRESINKLALKTGVDTIEGDNSVLDYLLGKHSKFLKKDHLCSDPPLTGKDKEDDYHTFNSVYATTICLRMLIYAYKLELKEFLANVILRVNNFDYLISPLAKIGSERSIIMHLSDIQCGKDSDENLRKEFLTALDKFISKNENKIIKPNILVVSGDLTSTGSPKEFKMCGEFIEKVATICGINKDRIVICPGNHDINWIFSKARYLDPLKLKAVEIGNKTKKLLEKLNVDIYDEEKITVVKKEEFFQELSNFRFAPYNQFISDFYNGQDIYIYVFDIKRQYVIYVMSEMQIIFVSFNALQKIDWKNSLKEKGDKINMEDFLSEDVFKYLKSDLKKVCKNSGFLNIGVIHMPLEISGLGQMFADFGLRVCLSGHFHYGREKGAIVREYGKKMGKYGVNVDFTTGTLSSQIQLYDKPEFRIIGIRFDKDYANGEVEYKLYPINCFLEISKVRTNGMGRDYFVSEIKLDEKSDAKEMKNNFVNNGETIWKILV